MVDRECDDCEGSGSDLRRTLFHPFFPTIILNMVAKPDEERFLSGDNGFYRVKPVLIG
jgi:hypothetical protein